jgi:hypothetical protein
MQARKFSSYLLSKKALIKQEILTGNSHANLNGASSLTSNEKIRMTNNPYVWK